MKRVLCSFFAILVLLSATSAYNGDILVYITRTGDCYHRDGCSYLKSRIEITLEIASRRGYRACSRCKPPKLGDDRVTDADPYMTAEERKRAEIIEEANLKAVQRAKDAEARASAAEKTAGKTAAKMEEMKKRGRLAGGLLALAIIPTWYYLTSVWRAKERKRIEQEVRASMLAPTPPPPQRVAMPVSSPAKAEKKLPKKMKSASPAKKSAYLKKAVPKPVEFPLHPDFAIPYRERYTGKSISKEAGVPEGAWFDEDDFPHSKSALGMDEFEVYITPSGKVYHTANCSCAKKVHAVNICAALAQNRRPCQHCKPMDTLPRWVTEYQRLRKLCRQCSIDMLP